MPAALVREMDAAGRDAARRRSRSSTAFIASMGSGYRPTVVLDGLDTIDWHRLHHAYGSAADVPALLRALLSDDAQVRDDARSELYGNLWHQGTVYEATVHAVPFLFELAMAASTPDRVEVVCYLGALAEGLDTRASAYPAVLAGVVEHRDDVRQLLRDPEPMVRAAAAYVAGAFASLVAEAIAWLRAAIEAEPDSLVRCGMLLSLARLAHGDAGHVAWLERHLGGATEEREQVATAIALAHAARASTSAAAVDILARAADDIDASEHRFRGIPWDLRHEEIAGEALEATGRAWTPPW